MNPFETYQIKKPKPPPHELAASVNEVISFLGESLGESKKYPYKYWLNKVKKSGKSYGDIMVIIKKAQGLDKKYNKGGFISNQLKI